MLPMGRPPRYWAIRLGLIGLCGFLAELSVWISVGQIVFSGVGVIVVLLLLGVWGVVQFENV